MSRRGRVWQEGRQKGAAARRGATWYFVVDIAPPGAKRRQVLRRGFSTQAAAQQALDELFAEVRGGTYVEPSKVTFGEYLGWWIEALPTTGRRPSTLKSYGRAIRSQVLGHEVAAIPLQSLTAIDLDRLYAHLLSEGGMKGTGLSMRSVRLLHTILQRALGDAERKDMLKRNPARFASPPSSSAARAPEFTAWTPAELRRFLELSADSHHSCALRVAAMTGLRRGELVGLRWDDIDLDAGRLTVRHTLLNIEGELVEGTPKTKRGLRSLDLDAATVAALRAHRTAQVETRLLVGPAYQDSGYVFTRPDGRPWNPESVAQVFDRLVARNGLRRIRFHDLRHTHASHLLAAGANPKVVSERLGHASVAFTLDVYSHVMPGQQADAAAAVAELVDGIL